MHVVVVYDGKVIHDPHPSGAGLVSTDGWFVLRPRSHEQAGSSGSSNEPEDKSKSEGDR